MSIIKQSNPSVSRENSDSITDGSTMKIKKIYFAGDVVDNHGRPMICIDVSDDPDPIYTFLLTTDQKNKDRPRSRSYLAVDNVMKRVIEI
jgi:hypothetical protein